MIDLYRGLKVIGAELDRELAPSMRAFNRLSDHIMRRRAEAIVAADAAGHPRRPIDELVGEFNDEDVRRLQGR